MLILSPYSKYDHFGGSIEINKFISAINSKNIYLITLYEKDIQSKNINTILKIVSRIFLAQTPMLFNFCKIFVTIKKYSIKKIIIGHLSQTLLALLVKIFFPRVKLYLINHNNELKYVKMINKKLKVFFYFYESFLIRLYWYISSFIYTKIFVLKNEDQKGFYSRTIVIPPKVNPPIKFSRSPGNKIRLLFIGSLNYFPNVEAIYFFIKNVFSKLNREKYEFCVAGRKPSKDLLNFLQINNCLVFPDYNSPAEIIVSNTIFVSPLISGTGVKIKIAEALSLGLQIVGSKESFSGYESILINNVDCRLARSIDEYLVSIADLNGNYSNINYFYYQKYYSPHAVDGKIIKELFE